jgi:hypothetical protein
VLGCGTRREVWFTLIARLKGDPWKLSEKSIAEIRPRSMPGFFGAMFCASWRFTISVAIATFTAHRNHRHHLDHHRRPARTALI